MPYVVETDQISSTEVEVVYDNDIKKIHKIKLLTTRDEALELLKKETIKRTISSMSHEDIYDAFFKCGERIRDYEIEQELHDLTGDFGYMMFWTFNVLGSSLYEKWSNKVWVCDADKVIHFRKRTEDNVCLYKLKGDPTFIWGFKLV